MGTRSAEISAKVAHVVPTAIVGNGVWYIGNLGLLARVPNRHHCWPRRRLLRVRAGLRFRGRRGARASHHCAL